MSAAVFYDKGKGGDTISQLRVEGHVSGRRHVVLESIQLVYVFRPAPDPTNLSEVCRRVDVSALVSLELHSENTLFRAHSL